MESTNVEGPNLALDALTRVRDVVRSLVSDLSPEELLASPKPHIAWLVWHIARVQDANFSGLLGSEQIWIANSWHARFNMPPDAKDYGSGHRHTPEQVDAFTVSDKELLLAYLDAVFDRTKAYLATLSNEDLARELDEPQYQPLPTLGVRLVSVINCNTRHVGQIDYLRGLIKRGGWFPGAG